MRVFPGARVPAPLQAALHCCGLELGAAFPGQLYGAPCCARWRGPLLREASVALCNFFLSAPSI